MNQRGQGADAPLQSGVCTPGGARRRAVLAALLAGAALTACTTSVELVDLTAGVPVDEVPERWASGVDVDDDRSGDLRPEAVTWLEARADDAPEASAPVLLAWRPPATIRIWRRALDGSTASCSGRVDVIPLETYVKGVLPHEWIRSWHGESLRAGAVAIRTYAASWVARGGKYTCADLDDTTASQVYRDQRFAVTDAAVDATASTFVMKNGVPVTAEYSAENGHPTATGISDSVCAGRARNGHGRGTCQWGSQRWASQQGKSATWILQHYYPGATVSRIDGGGGGGGTTPIIVDNNPAANDPAKARLELVGTWTASSATPGFHGTDYLWAATAPASAPATFWFYLPSAGARTIDAWWVAGTNRATAASFVLYDSAGTERGRVAKNQQLGGSQWNALGTFTFGAGWNRVVLSRWQATGSVVVADAIRVR